MSLGKTQENSQKLYHYGGVEMRNVLNLSRKNKSMSKV